MPTAHCLIASGAITTTSTRRSGMSLQLWRRILAAGAGLAARENHAPGKLSLGHVETVACTSGQCFCFCRVSPLLPFPGSCGRHRSFLDRLSWPPDRSLPYFVPPVRRQPCRTWTELSLVSLLEQNQGCVFTAQWG